MENLSSKEQVENKLDILNKVQRVETPDGMYENILMKIQNKKKNTISLTWIRTSAAAIFILIAAETYLLTSTSFSEQNENTASIESIIPNDNNTLYYE
jgi:hypothetical protein|tara:strand:- start:6066 stop:6359 length:294 start_codon:yes stop_codon:yes gene_type:complete